MSLSSFPSCFPADTTPTLDALKRTLFSCADHRAQFIHHCTFLRGHTALAQGEQEFVPRIRLHSFPYRLTSRCWTFRSSVFLQSYPHLLARLPRTSATSTSFVGSGQNLCASAHWSGMSGRLANPTQNTGYEPNLYSCINEEHTPINPPDSFQCRDDATTISAAEDPEAPYPGASSSSKQTAASKASTMSGSSGVSLCKQRPESVDSRASIQATGVNVDGE